MASWLAALTLYLGRLACAAFLYLIRKELDYEDHSRKLNRPEYAHPG